MSAPGWEPPRIALVRFRDALIDFSDDPSPENLRRYLAASRALTESRAARSRVEDPGVGGRPLPAH